MEIFGYIIITELSTAVILIPLYSGVLWHTFRGSKFTFIYMIATLLILANASLLVYAFVNKGAYSRHQVTLMESLVIRLSVSLYDLTQCVSHLLLAFKYRRVAKEMPYAIEEV